MKGNIKVILEGRGPLTLRESNYVTSGGEGAVYLAGQTIVKLYTDTAKMIRDGMVDKVKRLSYIKHSAIAAPTGVVTDESKHPLGFYMPMVEGEPLPRVFTTDFRTRSGFDDDDAKTVASEMRDATQCAHDNGAVMVDANEFNWIVDPKGFHPHVIDVDSWAIGRWSATVIMPSIRDWRAKAFDHYTDWFSWGIVAFQVFTGIHPYKGRIDGYKPGELERRMKDGVSVFAPGVRLPHSARDPSCIPGPLLDWFRAEFQDGERSTPPSPLDTTKTAPAARVLRVATSSSHGLLHEKIFSRHGTKVMRVWPCGVVLLETGQVADLDSGYAIGNLTHSQSDEVVRAGQGWLLAHYHPSGVTPAFWYSAGGKVTYLDFSLASRGLFRSDDRLFVITDSELVEVTLSKTEKPVLMIGQRWSCRPNAIKWLDGVAVQDVLGAAFLMLPTKTGLLQIRAKELDGLTPISGRGLGRFAAIVASDRNGVYHRVEFTFESDHTSYKAWVGPNDGPDLNMVVMPSGVVATVVDDGELVIFVPINGNINKIADRDVATDILLSRWDTKVVYIRDGDVWRMQVK